MLGTIVLSIANTASWLKVASNKSLTAAAIKAVSKLTPNQIERRWVLFTTGAKVSSSSSKPAMLIIECSASSRIISTTSSIVIRPNNLLFSSTTGADSQLYRSNKLATSLSIILAGMASESLINDSIDVSAAAVISRVNATPPINLSLRSTTYKVSVCSGISPFKRKYRKITSTLIPGRSEIASVFIIKPAVSSP